MITMLLNPAESVAAREELNLSQAKVSNDIGLNRSYLSQFESGKRVLEDHWLKDLINYYHQMGWDDPGHPESETTLKNDSGETSGDPIIYTRDGFVVAAELDEAEIEELLEEYYANAEKIDEIGGVELRRGFFGGVQEDHALPHVRQLLLLSWRQSCIKQRLHGQVDENLGLISSKIDDLTDVQGYVEHMFYQTVVAPEAA